MLRRCTLLLIGLAISAIALTQVAPSPALAQGPAGRGDTPLNRGGRGHVLPIKGSGPGNAARPATAAGNCALGCSPPLVYNGGPVMASSTTYAIFWLPSGSHYEPGGNDTSYQNLVSRFFNDAGGSSFYNILTQYSSDPTTGATVVDGPILNAAAFGGAWIDTSSYGGKGSTSNPLLDTDIQAEVTKAINTNHWTPSLTSIFFVYTGVGVQSCFDATHTTCTFFSQTQYCAYHSNGDGVHAASNVLYGNMPDMADCEQLLPSSPNSDPYADSAINLTSHEYSETVTDPLISAWYDAGAYGYEIGDECAWIFGPTGSSGGDLTLNSHPYIVQEEWSNADAACVLSDAGPGAPGAPTNVTATAGNRQATVLWTAPASIGTGPITTYTVTASTGGATASVSGTTTSATVGGLTNGTSYTFTVTAANATGTGPASAPSNAVTPSGPTPPGAPTNISAVAGNTQATVNWSAPVNTGNSPLLSYTVTAAPGGIATIASGSATSAAIAGLSNGTAYTFTVHATNVAGSSPESGPSNMVTPSATAPMTVGGAKIGGNLCTCNTLALAVGGIACTTATPLTYNASFTIQAGCGLAGQAVTFAINGAAAGLETATGGSCLAFAPGTAVSGVQVSTGFGVDSSCATVAGVPGAPGAPKNVAATAGSGQATIVWTAPSNNGGSPITAYTVKSSPGGIQVAASGAASSAVVSGLTNGTSYTFTVTATNALGTGPASTPSNAVTPSAPVPPSVPTGVIATAGNAQATVAWSAPTSNGNSPITGYTVTPSPGAIAAVAAGSAGSAIVGGLTNGVSYTLTVHATNAVGSSPESSSSNLVTPSATPPMSLSGAKIGGNLCSCNTLTLFIGGLACTNALSLSYNASFTMQAGCGIAGQAVTFTINNASAGLMTATGTTCLTFTPGATVSGLQVSTGYAQNSGCATVPGLPAAPAAPTGVTAAAGNAQAIVSWTAPTNNGGSPITGYTVTSAPGGINATAGGSANNTVVSGLANGTSYSFTVTATNAIGTGPASARSNLVTPSAPTAPGAPANVIAMAGDGQATVGWTAPASNGNSPITSYTVTASPGGVTVTVAGATSAVVTGLTDGTSYTFTVHATNGVGSGPESTVSNLVTPSATAPMTISGTKIGGNLCTCNTLTVSIGGMACTTSPLLSYNASFTLQAGCGTAGQAVTVAINGVAAGFLTTTGSTCLVFAPGTTVGSLQVSTGFAPNASCATAGSVASIR